MLLNYILIGLGVLFLGYGIFVVISKKYDHKKESQYTKESLIRCAVIEGISDILCAIGIIIAGLGNNGELLPSSFYYGGFIVSIVSLILDSVVESKLLVKLDNK